MTPKPQNPKTPLESILFIHLIICLKSVESVVDEVGWVRLGVRVGHNVGSVPIGHRVKPVSGPLPDQWWDPQLGRIGRVVRGEAGQDKADKHREDSILLIGERLRVLSVVCEVDSSAVHACASEPNVEAFFALVNRLWVYPAPARAMEHQFDQLRWSLVSVLVKLLLQLIHKVRLHCLILQL